MIAAVLRSIFGRAAKIASDAAATDRFRQKGRNSDVAAENAGRISIRQHRLDLRGIRRAPQNCEVTGL